MNKENKKCSNPQVSVIVPIYCVEEYICQCIDSVLSQTFKDFELILVDDGTSDNCGKICDDFAILDRRIIVVHKKNGGLSDARNAGLNVVTGKYVYFLDSDDWVDGHLIERLLGYMNQGYDLVSFNYYVAHLDYNSEEINHEVGEFYFDTDFLRKEFFIGKLLKSKIGWSAWDRIFRNDIIIENKIRFADNKKIFAEDLFFNCCYLAHCNSVKSVDDRLYYYRYREDSIMNTNGRLVNANCYNELAKELLNYFKLCSDCNCLIDIYPQIYYSLINKAVLRYMSINEVDISTMRELLINDISDIETFNYFMKELQNQAFISENAYTKKEFNEIKNTAKYYLSGNSFVFRLKNKLNYLS